MTRSDPPVSFLVPTCLTVIAGELSRLSILGELDVGSSRQEPSLRRTSQREPVLQNPTPQDQAPLDQALQDQALQDQVLQDQALQDPVPQGDPTLHCRLPAQHPARAQPLYSIRVPRQPAEVECPHSRKTFWAVGPTAYENDQPISDLAMLDGCRELGMLLALAAVTRAFGAVSLAAPEVGREALYQLAAFARVYETFAAKSGPRRPFDLPDEIAGDESSD